MATTGRHPSGNLTDRLFERPYEFELHQAIRLLELVLDADATIRFECDPSLDFPAAEIAAISGDRHDVTVKVRTQSLVGALGVLPRWYSELVLERIQKRDTSLYEFLNLFVNRMVRLEYESCAAVTAATVFERERRTGDAGPFKDLIRAGTGILPEAIGPLDERDLLACGGQAARRPVPARVLEAILAERLGAPVKVREFTGGWYAMPPESRIQLGMPPGTSGGLGDTAVLGDAMYLPHAAITVEIGPLSAKAAKLFWMSGTESAWRRCRSLVAFLAGETMDFTIDLLVNSDQPDGCILGAAPDTAAHLGVNLWLYPASPGPPARTRIWPIRKPGDQ
ncbi:MAG TPA: type VI secretion system baseplate subunit TssG [Candidatus Sulfopaludibacter sp.]|nr:type VI secretion system baseplate subunit TssG [Candidatus Sulfopaludibacter sp.]